MQSSYYSIFRWAGTLGLSCTLLGIWPGEPLWAQGPSTICGADNTAAQSLLPSSAVLTRASLDAEGILAGPRDPLLGDRALERLDLTGSHGARPDFASLASYCSAAGEAMRLARSGSAARARVYLRSALAAAAQTSDSELTARIAYRLALVSNRLPVRPNARSARRASSDRLQPLELPESAAAVDADDECSLLRSASLGEQSNWAASQLALACATRSAQSVGAAELISMAQLQGARISLAEAERRSVDRASLRQQASISAIEGLRGASGIGNPALRFELSARLIEALLETGTADLTEASRQIETLAALNPSAPGELALLEGLRARVANSQGKSEEAAHHARAAVYYESQRLQPLRLADWYMQLSRAVPSQRQEYVLQAYAALEVIRPILPQIDPITEESNFSLRMEPIFRAAVDTLLEEGAGDADAGRIATAQRIIESFRQAEIQSVFGSDCVPPRVPVGPEDLKLGEVLLYPVLLDDRVELIFAAKTDAAARPQYQRITVSDGASKDRIEGLVKQTAFELGYGVDDTWETPASELYHILIEPIEELIGHDATLVVVPDGILRRLPFAALRDAQGEMLIEKALLTIAPSLAYTQPGSQPDRNRAVVSASLSQSVDLPAGNFSALPATAAEARMAAAVASGGETGIYLPDFTRTDLRAAFARERIDVLHLATHASFNGRSDRSFIVSSDDAILLSELRQLIDENQVGGDLLTLIVLSACETALGDDQASMGLAGAAVQAGAESALASLWEVNDAGTAALMEEFYRNYAAGQGRAEALRNAQLTLMRGDGGVADPSVWAAFILLGAWR